MSTLKQGDSKHKGKRENTLPGKYKDKTQIDVIANAFANAIGNTKTNPNANVKPNEKGWLLTELKCLQQ